MESSITKLGWFYMYVSWLFAAKLCISDYFSYVEYQDLCATISAIKPAATQKQFKLCCYQKIKIKEQAVSSFTNMISLK